LGTKLDPHTQKITLVEMDFGQAQTLWFNWTAGTWYVDFDAIYELIDPIYLVGVSAQPSISKVGSVLENGSALASQVSVANCISTNSSFYYDIADRRLYIHLNGGAEASTRTVTMGITTGISNRACNYNNTYYEPRLVSAPSISKTKDPLFFGRISFDGGAIGIENTDGGYDSIVSGGAALWGGAIRILQGFDTDAYASFLKMAAGVIESVSISRDSVQVTMIDKRKNLSRMAPRRVFDIGTYPNINYANLGKPIPLAYGILYDVPCMCVNEEATAPATWDFKICDTTDHAIVSIDSIRSDGKTVTASASSTANGTFSLNGADFTVGTQVTAHIHGYSTTNAADVILDLMSTYLGIAYNATNFNTTEWATATALSLNVGLWVDSAREAFSIIEDVCVSSMMNLIQQDDGRYTLRKYDAARVVDQVLNADELLETPSVEYDTTQVISSTSVGYNRNWALGSFKRMHDTSQEAAIFLTYNVYRERSFETLLTSDADAQVFSTAMLSLYGKVTTKVRARFKLQPVGRELMDFVMLPIYRQGKPMLGDTKTEVYSISKDLLSATVEIGCRVV
jgi:hypothetical protein